MSDLEHDYDELWHIIEGSDHFGVEHHDVQTYDLYHPDHHFADHPSHDYGHHPVHGNDQYLRGALEGRDGTVHRIDAFMH